MSKLEAIERADGTYDLRLVASNGDVLWRDNQGRPKGNIRRDWKRIQTATASAKVEFVAHESPDHDPAKR